jgi:hypothetical protein
VTIINTRGMAFIGPGSEWFWAALQFTALTITFIAIYRQLRVARSATAIRQVEEYLKDFDSERMRRQRLAILVAIRDGTRIPESGGVAVGNYFERLAMLARKGHLDTKVLWGAISTSLKIYWVALDPFVKSSRADWGDATYADFEWLVRRIDRMDRREEGGVAEFNAAWVARQLPNLIDIQEDCIRIEQAVRSVVFATPDNLDAPHSAGARPATTPAPSPATDSKQEHKSD